MTRVKAFDDNNERSPNDITDLNPEIEYVNGKYALTACKFSGSIGIGKFKPVIDNCATASTSAINRPILPATDTRKKIMDMNTMLTKIPNKINCTT